MRFKTLKIFSAIFILSTLILACGGKSNPFFFEDDFTTVPEPFDISDEQPIKHDSGLIEYELKVGTGDFTTNRRDNVNVYYTGRKTSGEIFDSSYKNGNTTPSNLNVNGVIDGFREGLIGMKEGGKKVLVIPPKLAYEGTDNSLRNDTLVFDIELHSIVK